MPRSFVETLRPTAEWDQLVLPGESVEGLRKICAHAAEIPGLGEPGGPPGRGIAALFVGSSGTGKTMAAEVIGNHLNLDLYRIDLSGVVDKYIGETEKNLLRVFNDAERLNGILLMDNADLVFGRRTEAPHNLNRYANLETNYLAQWMEDYRGLLILTTDLREHIDPAFMRRLRFVVEFPHPDHEMRKRIWDKLLPAGYPIDEAELDALAQLELNGATIKAIVTNAVQMPFGRVGD